MRTDDVSWGSVLLLELGLVNQTVTDPTAYEVRFLVADWSFPDFFAPFLIIKP